jgi:hypothetical protein
MPIVDVTYSPRLGEGVLGRVAQMLPHAVSLAVECPEEPYDHDLGPGDVEIRVHSRGHLDPPGLDLLVEVHSKWFASRAETRQERCDQLCRAVSEASGGHSVGVYLSLPIAAWSQSE